MAKSIILAQKEFNDKLNDLFNEALQEMPAFILRPMVAEIFRQLEEIEKRQYEQEKQAYEATQEEGKGDEKET